MSKVKTFNWTAEHVNFLIDVVNNNSKLNSKGFPGIKRVSWKKVAVIFNSNFGVKLSSQALRSKYYTLSISPSDNNIDDIDISSDTTVNKTIINDNKVDCKGMTVLKNNHISLVGISKDLTGESKANPSKILQAFGYDAENWEMTSFSQSEWTQNSKKEGEIPLYAVKISVKPKKDVSYSDSDFNSQVEHLKNNVKPFKVDDKIIRKNTKNLLIIPIVDLHYGLVAKQHLTGNEYNTDIAEKRFYKILSESVSQCGKVDQIWLQLGSDFLNSDTMSGTTTAGTPQDNEDIGIKTIFEKAAEMLVSGVKYLSATTNVPVDVVNILSNHDELSSFALQVMLKEVFKSVKDVNIQCSQSPRVYYKFGNNLIGTAHHIKNSNEVVGIMSTEAKQYYADTNHKYFFLSHFHKEITSEGVYGIDIVRLPTVSGRSKWSNSQGYVGNKIIHQSFVINKEDGMSKRIYVNCEDAR